MPTTRCNSPIIPMSWSPAASRWRDEAKNYAATITCGAPIWERRADGGLTVQSWREERIRALSKSGVLVIIACAACLGRDLPALLKFDGKELGTLSHRVATSGFSARVGQGEAGSARLCWWFLCSLRREKESIRNCRGG